MLPTRDFPARARAGLPTATSCSPSSQLTAAPKADPKQAKPVELQNPLADFSQESFDVDQADRRRRTNPASGWAVSPTTGVTHWATFETKEPVGKPGGTLLTFTLHHQFNDHRIMLGRFRLSVTRVPRPIGLEPCRGVPGDRWPPSPRCAPRPSRTLLLAYFQRPIDEDCDSKVDARRTPARPRCRSIPSCQQLRSQLEPASRCRSTRLVQLRHDLEMSIKQAATRRLTAAQDIAWALINSPAFLFNH